MQDKNRVSKVAFAFIMSLLFMLLFLSSTFFLTSKRNIPNTEKDQYDTALRGSIISKDGFTVASSKELYRAEIDLRSIDENKLELFLKLFQIYSGLDDKQMQDIRTRLANASKRKNYNFILAQNLSPKTASHLKELAKKLYVQGFFKAFSNDNNRVEQEV